MIAQELFCWWKLHRWPSILYSTMKDWIDHHVNYCTMCYGFDINLVIKMISQIRLKPNVTITTLTPTTAVVGSVDCETEVFWGGSQNFIGLQNEFWVPLKARTKLDRVSLGTTINSSPPGQNGRNFTDDVFKWISMNENFCILIWISLSFVPKGPIENNPALV